MALILIVDDSPTEVHVMKKALEKSGYQTATAQDGAEGVRMAREMTPDLIFMDVVMPGSQRLPGDAHARQRSEDQDHSDHHGHLEGPGDRQDLGPAPGRGRLHGQTGFARPARGEGAGDSRGLMTLST